MNIQLINTIFLTIIIGVFPLISIVFSLIGMKIDNSKISLFGGFLLLPAMIVLLAIIK